MSFSELLQLKNEIPMLEFSALVAISDLVMAYQVF